VRASRLTGRLGEERGAVISIVALGLVALVLMVAFVVDVANWKIHKRHLQLQADAAALAAAHTLGFGGCSNTTIAADAHKYGGADASGAASLYNNQVGGTPASRMRILINSSGYYGDTGAGDNTDPNGAPCAAHYVDIKATETNLPWFLGFGGIVPKINAHARVSLLQQGAGNGTLPIAVPNPLPTVAAAIFINEGTGAILGSEILGPVGPSGSLELYGSGTSGLPLVTVAARTGVVIALSGKPATSFSLAGTLTQICQQNLTDCYDAGSGDPPTQGLSFIRGYTSGGEDGTPPHIPKLRSVELFPTGTCVSPYFSDGTCTFDLVAKIDAGTALPEANQIYGVNPGGIQLTASADTNCMLVAGADKCWHHLVTLPANTGPEDLEITWEETSGSLQIGSKLETCKTGTGNKCKDTFGNSQRAFSTKDTRSGPIKYMDVCTFDLDASCTQIHDQSYPTGAQHRFAVTIGIGGILRNATSTADPIVALRIKSQTGQSLDCDPGYTNLKTELAQGCRPTYIPNTGTPDCSTTNTSTLWASQQPWTCVAVNTGRQPNDVPAGLNLRILLNDKPPPNSCPPLGQNGHNNWSMFDPNYQPAPGDTRGQDGFPVGDRRILNAYLTTYGAFSHVNGTSGSVPVIGFGHFYVTGWYGQGGGFDNPCQGHGDDPVPNNDSGLIVGHFIRYIDAIGGDGTVACDPNSINACVLVMTK
jgi:putative Flp pilus-assembly TadE/G-like protein